MPHLRKFHSIAALCGDGLRPELQALFERLAVDPHSELFVRGDGMTQSGPDPKSEGAPLSRALDRRTPVANFAMLGAETRRELAMAAINREFYQSWRGPAPADQDLWSLVFDEETRRLLVRHEWQTSRHNGVEEFEVAEFLKEAGAEQTALIDSLFLVPADA
jgi:hypothetical protein